MVIEHYLEAVSKDVLGENPVRDVAKKIYRQHRLALDAIFEWRPDELTNVMDRLGESLKDRTGVHVIQADKGGVLFRTDFLDAKIPPLESYGFYGDRSACCFGVEANGDVVGLTFRYPIASDSTSQENVLRCEIIERLEGDSGSERWMTSDFGVECSAGDLYRSDETLLDFIDEVLEQAEDFVESRI